jgi:hypothetical protein
VYEIDPGTEHVVAALDVGTEPRNPALWAGVLWVADFAGDRLLRIRLR